MVPAVRLVLLAGLAALTLTVPSASGTATRPVRADPGRPAAPPVVDGFRSARTYDEVAEPVRLRIPAIGVDTPLQRLGRRPDGMIAVPDSPSVAGWYAEGPRPGQPGPAVVVGHVDSYRGPGVFFAVGGLAPGTLVQVDRADGTTVGFRVTSVSRVPKTGFPTDQVYLPTLQPSLRLVTCGGTFDYQKRSYRDNVIVYTVPAEAGG
jgi:hypothetical protein